MPDLDLEPVAKLDLEEVTNPAPNLDLEPVPSLDLEPVPRAAPDLSHARAAGRWNTAANVIGAVQDYAVSPLASPLRTVMDAVDAVDAKLGIKQPGSPSTADEFNRAMRQGGGWAGRAIGTVAAYNPNVPATPEARAAFAELAQGAGESAGGMLGVDILPQLPTFGGGEAAANLAKTAFAIQGYQALPAAATAAGTASTGTPQEQGAAYADLLANAAMAGIPLANILGQVRGMRARIAPPAGAEPAAPRVNLTGVSEFGGDAAPLEPVQTPGQPLTPPENALPIESPAALDVRQAPGNGPPLGQGDAGHQGPAATQVAFSAGEGAGTTQPGTPPQIITPDAALDTRTQLGAAPAFRVPAEQIAIRPDLMQFKRMDETATGVNAAEKLQGTWDDYKAGNLLLWEPADPSAYGLQGGEKYIVANGHHRFDFGERQDRTDYNAQIVREADGVSAGDARSLAAEINIADNKGTIYDQVKFLRNESATHGADAALARAGRIGIKGRQAAAIALQAGPETYDSFVNEQIKPDQAEAIAAAAPINGAMAGTEATAASALQRLGIRQALDGDSPQAIRNLIQAVRLEAAHVPAEQMDLFAADDTAIQTAQRLSKVATRIQGEISREIKATQNAAASATTARAKGITFERPPEEIIAENDKLKTERDRWDNWALHPDLVAQVRGYAQMMEKGEKPPPTGQAGAAAEAPEAKGNVKGETGQRLKEDYSQDDETKPQGEVPGRIEPDLPADWSEFDKRARSGQGDDSGKPAGALQPAPAQADTPSQIEAVRVAREMAWVDKWDAMLEGAKVKVGGKLYGGVQGLAVTVWNGSLHVAQLALRAGSAAAEAIQKGLDWIRANHPDAKFDEDEYRQAMDDVFHGRQRVQKILGSDQISEPVKDAVRPDLAYQVRSHEQLRAEAQEIVARQGDDAAFQIFQRSINTREISGDTRNALGAELQARARLAETTAKGKGDTATETAAQQRQVDLWRSEAYGTELAQALNAMKLYGDNSPQAKLKIAQGLFDEAGAKTMETQRPVADTIKNEMQAANGEAANGLKADPEVNRAARAAVDEHVAGSQETHRGVVMELTGPWADSPEILKQARQFVGERAQAMLEGAGAAFPKPSEHLRAILDDLAKRAAGIAANHYQGAEPGATLGQKLEQRLGISKEKAGQMAKAFDAEFARQVEKAKKQIPDRIAAMRARQQAGLAPSLEDAWLDKSIRKQLQDQNQLLGSLVSSSLKDVDVRGREIADRIVEDSDLKGNAADNLRDAISRRWTQLANAAKERRLKAMQATGAISGPLAKPGPVADIMKLTNLGAFDDAKYYDLVKRKLGLPVLDDAMAREIVSRATAADRLPAGDLRDRANTQLLTWIARQKPLGKLDLGLGIYISNILSGIKTPAKILLENTSLLAGQTLATLRDPTLLRHPIAFVAKPWAQGQLKGMLQSLEIMRSGIVTGVRGDIARVSNVLEQRPLGKLDWLNLWKYSLRIVAAAHLPTFRPAWELKQTAMAAHLAESEGLTGQALVRRVSDLMGNTETKIAEAKAQAAHEGITGKLDYWRRVSEILEQGREHELPGSTERARNYALHYTYLNRPYGLIGNIGEAARLGIQGIQRDSPAAAALAKSQILFTTVASNIINEHLNWSPVGMVRAALSYDNKLTRAWGTAGQLYGEPLKDPDARGDLWARACAGTALYGGLAYLVAQGLIRITGPGPASPDHRKQWQDAGHEPWSIEVGDRHYSFQNVPWAAGLGVMGAWGDWLRWNKGDQADGSSRLMFALKAIADQALSFKMLTGVHDLIEALSTSNQDGGAALEKIIARTAGNAVVPTWLRNVDQMFDPTIYDKTGVGGLLASQVPFVRRADRPVLNGLGESVQRELFTGWTGTASQDPVWRAIVDKGAWLPPPDRNRIIGNKKLGADFWHTITPDELYDLTADAGPRIRERLEMSLYGPTTIAGKHYDALPDLEPADAKELAQKISAEEHRKAAERLK